jgi:hypothetical protein
MDSASLLLTKVVNEQDSDFLGKNTHDYYKYPAHQFFYKGP